MSVRAVMMSSKRGVLMGKRAAGSSSEKVEGHSKRTRFSIDDLLCEEKTESVEESVVDSRRLSSTPPALLLPDVQCLLEGSELWAKFYDLGTEMIITKSGRRMFPTVKVAISTADIDALYYVFLDVVPVDSKRYRYIYNKSSWLTAGKAEPAPVNRLYMHPDSPFTGEQLQKQIVSFEKAKLTNNEVEKTSHLILNSMHKYQPRVHVVRRDRSFPLEGSTLASLNGEVSRTFVFPETQFMAVTAYQNQLITKLKIEKNPFAKGFRDPSGRDSDYESDPRPEMRSVLSGLYNPTLLQQALFSQYWLGKYPSLLSQVLLSSSLESPLPATAPPSLSASTSRPPSPAKSPHSPSSSSS